MDQVKQKNEENPAALDKKKQQRIDSIFGIVPIPIEAQTSKQKKNIIKTRVSYSQLNESSAPQIMDILKNTNKISKSKYKYK